MPDALSELEGLSTLLLATSLATERLIAILKTVVPSLAKEEITAEREVDLQADKKRRLVLQGLAIVASYVTVALVFDTWCPWKKVELGEWSYYQGVLAFLGSAGSAFWAGVVGYVKEVKDAKTVEVANRRHRFRMSAKGNADGVGLKA
jgi:hypothetical protein